MLGAARSGGNAVYLKIYDGRVVREWSRKPDNVPDLLERINKMDKTVYYVRYDFVSGMLVDVELLSSDQYGETIRLQLADGAERYVLDIPASSKYGVSFFQRMLAIDLNAQLTIRPYSFTDESGKQRTGLSLSQHNEKIGYHYKIEDVPALVEKTRGGKKTYDDTDRYNFFMEEFRKFQAKLKTQSPSALSMPVEADAEEDFDDDLPF